MHNIETARCIDRPGVTHRPALTLYSESTELQVHDAFRRRSAGISNLAFTEFPIWNHYCLMLEIVRFSSALMISEAGDWKNPPLD